MTIWEHRTVVVALERGEWRVDFGDGEVLVGLQTVLDYYGRRGWEVIAVQPQGWNAGSGQYGPWDVTRLLAIFKRPTPTSLEPAT